MVHTGMLAIAGRLLPLAGLLCLVACSGSESSPKDRVSKQVPAPQTPASLGVETFVVEPPGTGWLQTQNPEVDEPFASAPEEDAIATAPTQLIQATTSASGSYTEEEGFVGGFIDSGTITKTEEIVFAPGEQEKIIGGGTVATDTIHEYFFSASPGQQITVELQIEENHDAAFQVQYRSFGYWGTAFSDYPGIAARHWSGMLPKSDGEQYRIVVRPINGSDASYLMRIAKE